MAPSTEETNLQMWNQICACQCTHTITHTLVHDSHSSRQTIQPTIHTDHGRVRASGLTETDASRQLFNRYACVGLCVWCVLLPLLFVSARVCRVQFDCLRVSVCMRVGYFVPVYCIGIRFVACYQIYGYDSRECRVVVYPARDLDHTQQTCGSSARANRVP